MSTAVNLEHQLGQGINTLALSVSAEQQQQLLAFLQLLAKWNKAYNLTAIRDPEEMVSKHLLDSLAILPLLEAGEVIDIGTGPGLPGIPLAIVRPEQGFTLLDSNSKKTRFVNQAVMELGIQNVTVVQSRAEAYRPSQPFDVVVSRAFAEIGTFLEWIQHLCKPGCRIIAMKGQYPGEEMQGWPEGFECESIDKIAIPGLEAERHAVLIRYQNDQ